jgi:SagB-type dehydrogenase family enzyme
MVKHNPAIAAKFHRDTKHSPASVRSGSHYLDWRNKPNLFKHYLEGASIPLPRELPGSGMGALDALDVSSSHRREEILPTLNQIAYVLYYSAGVTKKLTNQQGEFYFRAAACAGALYPIEIYLACGELEGLSAGVYHFSPDKFSLTRLRAGDFRPLLVAASGEEQQVQHAPLVLIFSAITFRSAWKYRERSYRHHFWDSGTMLANALAATRALGLPAEVVVGFVDDDVNALIGVQTDTEKSLCLLPMGWTDAGLAAERLPIQPLNSTVQPVAPDPNLYPLIEELHQASKLENTAQVRSWRRVLPPKKIPAIIDKLYPLQPPQRSVLPQTSIEEVIRRRGSARKYARGGIDFSSLSAILRVANASFSADWLAPDGSLINNIFLNVHDVEGLPSGSYTYWREKDALELLDIGDFRGLSAFVCLEQPLAGDASVVLFFLADLQTLLEGYGNRGYRIAQLEAGILGGRIYLGAYAFGLGASGITFYDDEVVRLFSPRAVQMEAIFAITIGVTESLRGRRGRIVSIQPGDPVGPGLAP